METSTLPAAVASATPESGAARQMPFPGSPQILYVPRTIIRAFADQPRTIFDPAGLESLGQSILDDTQLIPAFAKRLNPPIGQFQFELIDGERRWQATELKKIDRFLIMVVEGNITPDEQFAKSVVANFFREPLGLMDLARAIDRFEKMGLSMEQIGKKMGGKSVTWAYQHHSLLRLAPGVQLLLGHPTPEKERISFQNALQLVDEEPSEQIRLASTISMEKMTMRKSRHFILKNTVMAGSATMKGKARTEFKILARLIRNTCEEAETSLDHKADVFKAIIDAGRPEEVKEMLQNLDDLLSSFEGLRDEIREAAGITKQQKPQD